MYLNIGCLIAAAIGAIFVILPVFEIWARFFLKKSSDFINEEKSDKEIRPKIFPWLYDFAEKKHNKKWKFKFEVDDYYSWVLLMAATCVILIFVWPLLIPVAIVYIILVVLRKIKRLEKLVKSIKEKKDVGKEEE